MTLSDPYTRFKVMVLFKGEYLKKVHFRDLLKVTIVC